MNIPPVSNMTYGQQTASAPTVDYQSFLRLLVAQMKNQDPTSPMESTDYIAQLATFSQVEQSVQMNKKLDEMLQASSLAQASGLIGRVIETMDGKVSGVIKQVEIYSDGVMAVLEDGKKVPITPGVIIRDANFTPPDDTPPNETPPENEEKA